MQPRLPPPRHLPLLLGNRICQGWPSGIANLAQGLQQIFHVQLIPLIQRLICNLNAVPNKLQCVEHLSSMLLRYKLLPVRWVGMKSINRWQKLWLRHLGVPNHIARDMLLLTIYPRTPLSSYNQMLLIKLLQHSKCNICAKLLIAHLHCSSLPNT